jgi:hypothetical protein
MDLNLSDAAEGISEIRDYREFADQFMQAADYMNDVEILMQIDRMF